MLAAISRCKKKSGAEYLTEWPYPQMDALLSHVGRRGRMVGSRRHVGQLRRAFGSRWLGRRGRRSCRSIRRWVETNVLVSFGAAQFAGDVVDRVVVHAAAGHRRRLQLDVLVSWRFSTGHFDVVACTLDPETGPWGPRVGRFASRSCPCQIHQLVTGRGSSRQTFLFRLQLGRKEILRRRVDAVTRRLPRLLTSDASRQRFVMNRHALQFPRGFLRRVGLHTHTQTNRQKVNNPKTFTPSRPLPFQFFYTTHPSSLIKEITVRAVEPEFVDQRKWRSVSQLPPRPIRDCQRSHFKREKERKKGRVRINLPILWLPKAHRSWASTGRHYGARD